MSSNEVIQALGVPLRIDSQRFSERWLFYSSNSFALVSNSSTFTSTGKSPTGDVVICFDSKGFVIGQIGLTDDFHGTERSVVVKRLGPPSKVASNSPVTILNFTLGKYSGSHDVRAVILDEFGNVSSKSAFFYRD